MADYSLTELSCSGIYQIWNTKNGKRYIGSAKSFKVRWAKHISDLRIGKHHSAYLQRSWNAHGSEAFLFEIVEFCDVPELIVREQDWLDTYLPEYNVSPTAANCTGVKHSEATKLKRSAALRGKKASPESLAKRIGQKRTAEQRANISAANRLWYESLSPEQKLERAAKIAAVNRDRLTGRKQSPELIAKRAAGMIGRVVSAETRTKLSAANKGKKQSAQAIAKSAAARKGIKLSAATIEKMKARRASDETKKKMSDALKGRKVSDETRAKIGAAHKGMKLSPEAIAKRTATRMERGGYVVSEETRIKLSEAGRERGAVISATTKARWADPEYRNKMSAVKLGKPWSETRRESFLKKKTEAA